jgi:hypothetical protein
MLRMSPRFRRARQIVNCALRVQGFNAALFRAAEVLPVHTLVFLA